MERPLRFQAPELPSLSEIDGFYRKSVQAGWFSNNGPCVREFEDRTGEFLGLETRAVTCNNATSGLLIALRAAFGEPNPSRPFVALPSFTFVASVAAVSWGGWIPLFLDIDEDDWQVSDAALSSLGDRRDQVAGLMLGSTFGAGLTTARRSSTENHLAGLDLPVVVDSAAGFGAHDEDGRPLGVNGTIEVFSFHATKPFAIGEGGLLTSRSTDVLERARSLANFGFDAKRELPGPIGINAKMSELHAAVGLAVLEDFEDVLRRRRDISLWLLDELESYDVRYQPAAAGSTFQFVAVRLPSVRVRERVLRLAEEQRIELRVYFDPPMHRVPAYRDALRVGDLAETDKLAEEIVCLPMSNSFRPDDAERLRALVALASRG